MAQAAEAQDLDVVQHPQLGELKFPKDMPIADRNESIERLELKLGINPPAVPKPQVPMEEMNLFDSSRAGALSAGVAPAGKLTHLPLVNPHAPTYREGVSDVMLAATPLAAVATPVQVISAVAGGTAGGYGAKKVAEKLGGGKTTQELAETGGQLVGGLAGGYAAEKGTALIPRPGPGISPKPTTPTHEIPPGGTTPESSAIARTILAHPLPLTDAPIHTYDPKSLLPADAFTGVDKVGGLPDFRDVKGPAFKEMRKPSTESYPGWPISNRMDRPKPISVPKEMRTEDWPGIKERFQEKVSNASTPGNITGKAAQLGLQVVDKLIPGAKPATKIAGKLGLPKYARDGSEILLGNEPLIRPPRRPGQDFSGEDRGPINLGPGNAPRIGVGDSTTTDFEGTRIPLSNEPLNLTDANGKVIPKHIEDFSGVGLPGITPGRKINPEFGKAAMQKMLDLGWTQAEIGRIGQLPNNWQVLEGILRNGIRPPESVIITVSPEDTFPKETKIGDKPIDTGRGGSGGKGKLEITDRPASVKYDPETNTFRRLWNEDDGFIDFTRLLEVFRKAAQQPDRVVSEVAKPKQDLVIPDVNTKLPTIGMNDLRAGDKVVIKGTELANGTVSPSRIIDAPSDRQQMWKAIGKNPNNLTHVWRDDKWFRVVQPGADVNLIQPPDAPPAKKLAPTVIPKGKSELTIPTLGPGSRGPSGGRLTAEDMASLNTMRDRFDNAIANDSHLTKYDPTRYEQIREDIERLQAAQKSSIPGKMAASRKNPIIINGDNVLSILNLLETGQDNFGPFKPGEKITFNDSLGVIMGEKKPLFEWNPDKGEEGGWDYAHGHKEFQQWQGGGHASFQPFDTTNIIKQVLGKPLDSPTPTIADIKKALLQELGEVFTAAEESKSKDVKKVWKQSTSVSGGSQDSENPSKDWQFQNKKNYNGREITVTNYEDYLAPFLTEHMGFIRQYQIGYGHYVDFADPVSRTVVEVDGPAHYGPGGERTKVDLSREKEIRKAGWQVIHVKNEDLRYGDNADVMKVVEKLKGQIQENKDIQQGFRDTQYVKKMGRDDIQQLYRELENDVKNGVSKEDREAKREARMWEIMVKYLRERGPDPMIKEQNRRK